MDNVISLFKSEQLESLLSAKNLVTIIRDNLNTANLHGFILAYSPDFLLIQYVYDFRIDGLMVLRRKDISEIKTSKTDEFQT